MPFIYPVDSSPALEEVVGEAISPNSQVEIVSQLSRELLVAMKNGSPISELIDTTKCYLALGGSPRELWRDMHCLAPQERNYLYLLYLATVIGVAERI